MKNFEGPQVTTAKPEFTDASGPNGNRDEIVVSRDASDLLPRLPRSNGDLGQVGSNASVIGPIKVARFKEAEKRLGGPIEPRPGSD